MFHLSLFVHPYWVRLFIGCCLALKLDVKGFLIYHFVPEMLAFGKALMEFDKVRVTLDYFGEKQCPNNFVRYLMSRHVCIDRKCYKRDTEIKFCHKNYYKWLIFSLLRTHTQSWSGTQYEPDFKLQLQANQRDDEDTKGLFYFYKFSHLAVTDVDRSEMPGGRWKNVVIFYSVEDEKVLRSIWNNDVNLWALVSDEGKIIHLSYMFELYDSKYFQYHANLKIQDLYLSYCRWRAYESGSVIIVSSDKMHYVGKDKKVSFSSY